MNFATLMKNIFGEYWIIIVLAIPITIYFGIYIVRYLYKVHYEKITIDDISKEIEVSLINENIFRKLLVKKILIEFFLIYSASFLAAVLPSNPRDPISSVIYLICMLVYIFYLLHVIFYAYSYLKSKGLTACFSQGGISWEKSGKKGELIISGKISLFEQGNVLHFSDSEKNTLQIPLFLLKSRKMQNDLLSNLNPENKGIIEKGKQGLDVFESVIIALILAMHIRQFIVQAFYIPSGSMEMTLRVGDHLLVDKFSLGTFFPPILGMEKPIHLKSLAFSKIKRGDILVFRPPIANEYREFIKRVIGLPGDTFEIKGGTVYINNQKSDEPYTNQHKADWRKYYQYLSKKRASLYSSPSCPRINYTEEQTGIHSKIKIPPGKYLMLGDHRDNSSDSRTWGLVPRERIKGRAWVLYFNYYDFIKNFDFMRLGFIH